MTLPYPVPPSVVAVADLLEDTAVRSEKVWSFKSTYLLELLNPRFEVTHRSPLFASIAGLSSYIYGFSENVAVLGIWRFRLTLWAEFDGRKVVFSKIFVVDTGTVTPKGKQRVQVAINGQSKSVSKAVIELRLVSVAAVKRSHPGNSGFSTSRPVRPNESSTKSYEELFWTRFGWTGAWNGTPTTKSYTEKSRVWTGTRTPGFGSLKAKRLPVNPHTVSLRRTANGHLLQATFNTSNGNSSGWSSVHTLFYPGASEPTHLASAQTTALGRLIGAAKVDIEANIAQDLAQFGQTLRLIRTTLDRLRGALGSVRKKDFSGAIQYLWGNATPRFRRKGGLSKTKTTAQNWLELQYGWKPLINDVHGVMQALANLKIGDSYVVRTTSSAMAKTTETSSVYANAYPAPAAPAGVKTVIRHTRCKLYIYWSIDDYLKSFLAQTGFTNPVNLAWELIPFSFVIDWFLPIGPFLETLSSWDGLVFLGGGQTSFTRQWTDVALSYDRTDPLNPSAHKWGSSSYHDEWVRLDRVKLTTFPSSQLPSFKNGLKSVTHVANALALLRASFLK